MIRILPLLLLILSISYCTNSQHQNNYKLVGGPCEGCQAVLEFSNKELKSIDTLPDFHEAGTRIKVKGTVYQNDGKTPAKNVILYIYHTNQEGIYSPKKDAKGWGRKHGYNRIWLKTDQNGYYAYYTIVPAPYPNRSEAAHIHYTILEPNGKYYWISSCHFKGDSLLTDKEINPDSPRGSSSGLLDLQKDGDLLVGTRDIILGRNIPGYN